RLYSKPYYERFGEGMEQTFNDLLRERAEEERGLFACALWMFIETSAGIIRQNIKFMIMQNKNIIRITLATAFILLLPLLAMQFTDEVVWDLTDFAVAGALLFGAGLTYELVARKAGNIAYRAAVGLAVAAALILIWVNLAVGLIGSKDNPANLIYVGVLAVGIIGAIIARLQSHGMARALFATALAQALIAVIALIAGMDPYPGSSVSEIVNLNVFFVALWVGSALLFRRASATGSKRNRRLE
ncbi:MAG: hypothetical protein V3W19_01675, partial [Desulfatiglandales bacterium]